MIIALLLPLLSPSVPAQSFAPVAETTTRVIVIGQDKDYQKAQQQAENQARAYGSYTIVSTSSGMDAISGMWIYRMVLDVKA